MDCKKAEAKDWAREHMKGVCNVIMPSFDADLRTLNEEATRTYACEEASHGVRANVVCPGSTWTPFTSSRAKERGLTEEELKTRGMMAGGLVGRWAEPEEIANPIMFLASDEASFITGAVLMADGGFSVT